MLQRFKGGEEWSKCVNKLKIVVKLILNNRYHIEFMNLHFKYVEMP